MRSAGFRPLKICINMKKKDKHGIFIVLTLLLSINHVCHGMVQDTIIVLSADTVRSYHKQYKFSNNIDTLKKLSNRNEIKRDNYLLQKDWVRQGIAPTFLLTSSFLTWGSREDIKQVRNRYVPNFSNHLDDYMQYAPAGAVAGLNLAGKKGLNGWKRQTINWGVSMAIMGTLVNSIKHTTKVKRPDGTSYNSFPSGHTATAFMNATFLHKEYGTVNPLYSIAGYGSSSYVGVSRSLNNRHWISDILAGAAIGIISTELTYVIVDHFYKNKGDYFSDFRVQEEIDKPSYFAARMGYSFDITGGDFSVLGVESSVEGAFYFNKRWGIVGEIIFGNYPIENQEWPDGDFELPEIIIRNPQQDFQSMGMFYFMAGPQYTKMLGSKFLLQVKATAGITIGTKGEMSLYGVAQDKETGMQEDITLPLVEYKPRNSFVAGTGISFTAMMAPRIGLTWFTDYKYSRLTFDITPARKTFGEQLDYIQEKGSMSLNNLSSGLRFTAFF